MAPAPKTPERFAYLDGLRGVAASMVLLQHTLEQTPVLMVPGNCLGAFMLENVNLGRLGVILFFLISGFLIPSTLKPGPHALGKFGISRVARLYPLYWVSLVSGAALMALLALPMLSAGGFAASLTMVQKVFGVKDLYGPYWTLFVELLFYATCVLLFVGGQLYKPGRILGLVLAGVLASMGISVATLYTGKLGAVHGALLQLDGLGNYLLVMLTGYLFRLHHDGKLGGRALATAVGSIVACYLVYAVSRTFIHGGEELLMPRAIFISSALGLGIFWLTLRYQLWQQRAVGYVGMISYGLYLFHAQVIHVALWLLGGVAVNAGQTLALIAFVALATGIVAHVAHYMIEKPGIKLGLLLRLRLGR